MKITLIIVWFALANLYTQNAKAQRPLNCGNPIIDLQALQKASNYILLRKNDNSALQGVNTVNAAIRVYFHILRYDDGTNPSATPDQITSEYNSLIVTYSGGNICFLNAGFDYINNSYLDSSFNANTDNTNLFAPYQVPACINVFYAQKIKGANGACTNNCGIGGNSFQIPNTFCMISSSNIGFGQTLAHEVAHCLGLLHTFDTSNGVETINGSNSSTAGDLVTDTPADPYGKTAVCYSTTANGCLYTGNCTDSNGATNYTPPYTNLMAYWWASAKPTCYPNLAATSAQFSRVNATLNTYLTLQSCQSPLNYTLNSVTVSSGYFFQSAINTLNTLGNISLLGSVVSTLGGSHTLLEPGFKAQPSSGKIIIRAIPCN